MGALKYAVVSVVIVAVIAIALVLLLQTPHRAPVQYFGSPSGYEAFVPNGQTINYNGHTDPVGYLILNDPVGYLILNDPVGYLILNDPVGYLILNNGTTIHNVIWDGQYAGTIIQNDNQIDQLNNQFVGQTDPINNQQYVPLQDLYVIKGQVPVEQVTINGQTYYVIDANKINSANIAGFYTYDKWVSNFVEAINTPGTYAAGLPGNSPVFQWTNTTGTLPYQIILYTQNCQNCAGGEILVSPNGIIIPYGIFNNPFGSSFNYLLSSQQLYTPPS